MVQLLFFLQNNAHLDIHSGITSAEDFCASKTREVTSISI